MIDQQSYISSPPQLRVFISDRKCSKVVTKLSSYILPYNGQSIPIILDFNECFPVDGLIIQGVLANTTYVSMQDSSFELKYQQQSQNQT